MARLAETAAATNRVSDSDVIVLREPEISRLERDFSDRPLVVVSGSRSAATALSRRRAAWALLPLDATDADVRAAVRFVAAGLIVQPNATARLPDAAGAGDGPAHDSGKSHIEPLTKRELDVLQQLAEGLSNHAIARTLGISDHTVKFHLASIFGKLGAATRTEAVRRGLRLGLVTI